MAPMAESNLFTAARMAHYLPVADLETVADYSWPDDWNLGDRRWVGEAYRDTCFFLRPSDDPETLRLVVLDTSDFPDELADRFLGTVGLPITLNLTWAEVRAALGKPIARPKSVSVRHPARAARFDLGALQLFVEVSDDWGIVYLVVLAPFAGLDIRTLTIE
jgi:hypothetical protein